MASRYYEIQKSHKGWLGLELSVPSAAAVIGNVVAVNDLPVVIKSSADADGLCMCHFGAFAIQDVDVNAVNADGNSAVAIGQKIYYTAADAIPRSKKATGTFVGYALEAITSGSSDTIKVAVIA